MNGGRLSERAELLRRAFDEAFASAPPDERAATEDFLAIRVAGDPFAVPIASIARLAAAPKIVPVPSRRASVVGVVALRGVLVSVHSLAVLLAYPAHAAHRWVAIAAGSEAFGLAFEELDGFLRVPRGAQGALEHGGVTRRIIEVDAIVRVITTTGEAGPTRSKV